MVIYIAILDTSIIASFAIVEIEIIKNITCLAFCLCVKIEIIPTNGMIIPRAHPIIDCGLNKVNNPGGTLPSITYWTERSNLSLVEAVIQIRSPQKQTNKIRLPQNSMEPLFK